MKEEIQKEEMRKKVEKEYPMFRPDKKRLALILKHKTNLERRLAKRLTLLEEITKFRVEQGLSLRETAKKLGYSYEWIRQLQQLSTQLLTSNK